MEAEHIDKRVQQELRPKLAAAPNHEMRLQRSEIGCSDSANASDRADVGQRVTAATNLHEMTKQLASRGAPFGRSLENIGQRRLQLHGVRDAIQVDEGAAPSAVREIEQCQTACVRQHDGKADEGGGREQNPIERTYATRGELCVAHPRARRRVGRAITPADFEGARRVVLRLRRAR
jgi:hypothetical protein